MKLAILCLVAVLGVVIADDFEDNMREVASRREGEAFKRNQGVINERQKSIDSNFGGLGRDRPNNADMQAFNNRVKMDYNKNQESHAGADRGLAKADIAGRNQAAATGYGNSGGSAFANKKHGQMRLSKDGSGEDHADFTGQGVKQIKTEAQKDGRNLDKFLASGEGLHAKIDPVKATNAEHEGGLFFKNDDKRTDEFWLYEVDNKNKDDVAAVITDESQGKGSTADQGFLSRLLGQSNQKKYRCVAQKVGESLCYDQNGKKVGKTVAGDDGTVVVYNKYNIPVARGKVKKLSNNRYEAVIGEGLMTAKTSEIKYYDCMRESGSRLQSQVKLVKPVNFKYNSESTRDGVKTFQWPDCFELSGRLELGKGVDPARIATEFNVNVLPAGKLRCMDAGTCGRECFYCDYCQKEHKLDILDNAAGNICSATGRTVDIKGTFCPPPEAFNMAACGKFSKSFAEQDYWKKKGDLDTTMRFYLRPENRDALIKKYKDEMSNRWLGAIAKSSLKLEWALANGIATGSGSATDSELLEFYIQKKNKDVLIGCERALVKYGVGGSKVDGSALIETAALAGGVPSVFKEKPCKEWSQLDQEQFEKEMAAAG